MTSLALVSVAVGGALGASLRYAASVWTLRGLGSGFPVATLGVNVVGGLLMGLAAALLLGRAGLPGWLPAGVMTGVLGGLTTFSAFSLETVAMIERGEPARAALYVALSVALSVGACAAGLAVGRSLA